MRRALPLALILALPACADNSARPHAPAAPASELAALPRVVRPRASPAEATSVSPGGDASADDDAGALAPPPPRLEGGAALGRFFEALAELEVGRARQDVRVVQLGDSHTAGDLATAVVRRALQRRFGDGGRGFVAVGAPFKHHAQDGARFGMARAFAPERGKVQRGRFVGDGLYGLGGVAVAASRRGARAWVDLAAPASVLEVHFLARPRGGSFDVLVDGVLRGRVATRAPETRSGRRAFEVAEAPHRLEVRAAGDGEVRLFGVALDRPRIGVVLDALGVNGARAASVLTWSEAHMADALRARAPALVILAYGTNEVDDDVPLDVYERQVVDVLGRVARAVPTASCLLLGPPDRAVETLGEWGEPPRLAAIVEVQRRVAAAAGCAFFDQRAAMGGPGSMARWASLDAPRARPDRVHLTREGYAELGGALVTALLAEYDGWRAAASAAP